MIVIGIDPGINGAWAAIKDGKLIALDELPTVGDGTKRMVSGELFAGRLEFFSEQEGPIGRVIIERVSAAPVNGRVQGTSSMFRFGQAYGVILGVVGALALPSLPVEPKVWKGHFGLYADKEASRLLAIRTWPDIAHIAFKHKKDHGKAEAALIALWGYRAAQVAGEVAA
jgi:crossover junction endodeoxyribonuclease RuvC